MGHRFVILGILVLALLAAILLKSDRPQEARLDSESPAVSQRLREQAPEGAFSGLTSEDDVEATQVPESQAPAPTPVAQETPPPQAEPAPPAATAPAEPVVEQTPAPLTLDEPIVIKDLPKEEPAALPYSWVSPAQESQPAFVDPNRSDVRVPPSGSKVLAEPLPTGPDWNQLFRGE